MKKLFTNGTIITMNHDIIVNSILIEDSRIIKVENDITDTEAEVIDLNGNTMLPAFIDAHSHLTSYASSLLEADLEDVKSLEELKIRLNDFIKENDIKEQDWLIGSGYDHNLLQEKSHPTKEFLDFAFPNYKVVVKHASSHFGVFNTNALQELQVVGDKNGYLEENEYVKAVKRTPMPSIEKLMHAYQKALEQYSSYGITTIQEGMMVKEMIPLYQALLNYHILSLDVIGYPAVADADIFYNTFKDYQTTYKNHFRLGGYKMILDGSPQGKTAWMLTPYQNDNSYFGYGNMTDDEVYKAVLKSKLNHKQILAHCNGDRAAKQYINAIDKVNEETPGEIEKTVMIHAQLLNIEQIKDVKRLNIIPSFFIAHTYYWGDTHIENFGFDRASKISPVRECIDKNILYTFHQDTPVIKPNMLETIWCAVNRITKNGIVLGEEEKISVYDALKGVTINAAIQYGEENEKGSIEVGKLANFVIINENILSINPKQIRNIKLLETIDKGNTIYKKQK